MGAWIKGKARPVAAALDHAAAVLRASRQPLFCGMAVDMSAGRAAIHLASRIGGVVDHAHSQFQAHLNRVMQDRGMMFAMPTEARQRADVVVIAGTAAAGSALGQDLAASIPDVRFVPDARRTVIRLHTGRNAKADRTGIPGGSNGLPNTFCLLSAVLNGRPLSPAVTQSADGKAITRIAETLRSARFGVMVWSPRDMDAVTIELMGRVVEDLNAKTRWTTLPVHESGNAVGIDQVMGWTTGFPVRTSFGTGRPVHDAWLNDANRLAVTGEADAALWLSTIERDAPDLPRRLPLVAIAAPSTPFKNAPEVLIETGVPGRDHDAELYDARTMTIRHHAATAPSGNPSAASIIDALAARLEAR
jgi:formylmethanofuran dehydrogenase subunit B